MVDMAEDTCYRGAKGKKFRRERSGSVEGKLVILGLEGEMNIRTKDKHQMQLRRR